MPRDLPWESEDLYWFLNWIQREQEVRGLESIHLSLTGVDAPPAELISEIRQAITAPTVTDPEL